MQDEQEHDEGPRDLQSAITVLQTPSAGIDARIASLRFLQDFVLHGGHNGTIDARLRKNINELVLSSVLGLTMSEDRITDLRRRQLVKAECFLILGRLLGSNTLFGNVREKLDEIEKGNATTRLLAEHEQEAEARAGVRQISPLSPTHGAHEYSNGASQAVRQSLSAGEGSVGRLKLDASGDSDRTPIKRRVQLQNPIHSGSKKKSAKNAIRREEAWGSPEGKTNSPHAGAAFASPEGVAPDTLTRMLPPTPDGWMETSPTPSTGSYDTPTKVGSDETSIGTDGKPRPPPRMGPPGGWVREEKDDSGQSQSPSLIKKKKPKRVRMVGLDSPEDNSTVESSTTFDTSNDSQSTHRMQVGIMSGGNSGSLSSDLAYGRRGPDLSMLKPVLYKAPRKLLTNKKLAPRPSGFMSGKFELDNFAPGVDPTNFFEQDKRLGYQKPRVFFPIPGALPNLDKSLMPEARSIRSELKPDAIVQEFLQMRAMLSYVGDMVNLPYTNRKKGITKTAAGVQALTKEGHFAGQTAKPLRRLAGVMEPDGFENAVEQAMAIWSPLVGANVPKPKVRAYGTRVKRGEVDPTLTQTALKLGDTYGGVPPPKEPWEPAEPLSPTKSGLNAVPRAADDEAGAAAERSILITKGVLRKLLRREGKDRQRIHGAMQHTMNVLNRNEYVSRTAVEQEQQAILSALDDQQRTVQEEMRTIKQLSVHTAAAQYATLPKRYLLLIEGKEANPRELIAKMTHHYCRMRSRNWLVLAWGKWKAIVVLAEIDRKKPIYARTAACYLMKEWATNRKLKQMRKQLQQWADNAAKMIFADRNKAVLPIQTQYRKYRDRCLIMRMHLQGAYDGPLSDIELGAERDIPFKIPAVIRSTRREIWYGVVSIQTVFRRFSIYRHTVKRRRQVILLQSVIRMFPKREIFKRLKYHVVRMQAYARRTMVRRKWCYMKIQVIIAQSYIRRFLKQIWKTKLFHKAWRIQERRMGAVILIQCRWREFWAKSRVMSIVKNRADREWAALQFQRNWFRIKRAYHTFVLMACLRAAEREDIKFSEYITKRGRYYNARTIQIPYASRFFRRNVAAAVKIQCKFRGFYGFNVMEILRREKWACRRLCHWARGALRRKMARARQIQRAWWSHKRGSLLHHFQQKAQLSDTISQKKIDEVRYLAACRVQALVLGIWARRWARRTRAASVIQRPARFYIARVGWKRQLRMRNRSAVKAWVDKTVNMQIGFRVKIIVKVHSRLMIRPQSLVRGFLVRRMFEAAKRAAHVYAMAIIKIQRLWRSNGAMSQAVAEIMMRRRAATNPFRDCPNIHKLLKMYFEKTANMYSTRDPRVGMKVSTLLYRIGLGYLVPMFPPRQFADVSDLRELDLPLLEEMHGEWRAYQNKKDLQQGIKASKRKAVAPLEHFKWLLTVVRPELVPRGPSEIANVQNAGCVVECYQQTPHEAAISVQMRFIKKFGHSQAQRAVNFGEKLRSMWFGYNNFKAFGEVVTPGMVTRALEDSKEGSSVWTAVQNMLSRPEKEVTQELARDRARVAECAEMSQLACEQALVLLGGSIDDGDQEDPIYRAIHKAYTHVISYKRRFAYMSDKMVQEKKVHATNLAVDGKNDFKFTWALPESEHKREMTAMESSDLAYTGSKAEFEFEMNVSIVKMYQEAFNQLYTASSGVQSIKTKWFIYTVRKAIQGARMKRWKLDKREDYFEERHGNHVLAYWTKFKAANAVARKIQLMLKAAQERKLAIEETLSHIIRYGWEERIDEQGYAYYADVLDRGYDPTYDMPRYNEEQWDVMSMLQRRTKLLLERLREKRRIKDEARLAEMMEIEARWMEEIAKGKKAIALQLGARTNPIKRILLETVINEAAEADKVVREVARKEAEKIFRHEHPGEPLPPHLVRPPGTSRKTPDPGGENFNNSVVDPTLFADGSEMKLAASDAAYEKELELSLPWPLRFEEEPKLVPGQWVLLRRPLLQRPKSVVHINAEENDGEGGDNFKALPMEANITGIEKDANNRRSSIAISATKKSKKKNDKNSKPIVSDAQKKYDLQQAALKNSPFVKRSGKYVYEAVVVFKFRKALAKKIHVEPTVGGSATPQTAHAGIAVVEDPGILCDTKNFYGERTVGVNTRDIFLMNMDIGMKVECRFEKAMSFYRGKVMSSSENHLFNTVYSVLYDDGESEQKVTRDLIRPSADELEDWFYKRNTTLKSTILQLSRKKHYAELRRKRESAKYEKAYYSYKAYVENNPLEEELIIVAAPKLVKKKDAKGEEVELTREEVKKMEADAKESQANAELERVSRRTKQQVAVIESLFSDDLYGEWFQKAEEGQSITFNVTKLEYRMGWVEVHEMTEEGPVLSFKNSLNGKTTSSPPIYKPEHDFSARKLQANWKIRRARKYFKRLLGSESLDDIISNAIKRYQKHAWVGFENEGITTLMTIRRMGFYLVADCVEDKFQFAQDELKELTVEKLAKTPSDLYEKYGIVGMDKIKAMKDFQTWYQKTQPFLRERSIQLINFFSDVDDKRPLAEVIGTGEPIICEKFIKQYPSGAARTQKFVREAVDKSVYPHTMAMVEVYLKKYGDKADLARENIGELVDKKTTSHWKQEKEAYQILWGATRRLLTLVGGLKVKQIIENLHDAENEAIETMSPITGISPASIKAAEQAQQARLNAIRTGKPVPVEVKPDVEEKKETGAKAIAKRTDKGKSKNKGKQIDEKKGRDNCSGPEGRAALVLRVKVMRYMQRVLWATAILQRRLRGFTKRSSVWKVIHKRRDAVLLIQRAMRGCMDRSVAIDLREQQRSPLEQLWDANREMVYYYDRSTGKSTYLEPSQAYRPLVRDRLSQALVQAWPSIDQGREAENKNNFGLPAGLANFAPSLAMCCVCNARKCTRLCTDCGTIQNRDNPDSKGPSEMPYCFPCFTMAHATDDTEHHRFSDAAEAATKDQGGLVCCMCTTAPATRKCQGILDDSQIDELCSVLQRSASRLWPEILAKANVGGERKLALMLQGIMGSGSDAGAAASHFSPAQLQQVRMMLERTRAECDEVYCEECYKEVHAGGRRLLHKWVGFKANADICSVCTKSPAEVVCKECDDHKYCNSCFRVFHAMGRKRKHKHSQLLEELEYGQDYCLVCTRRTGTVLCQNVLGKGEDGICRKRHCDSCYECVHKPLCDAVSEDLRNKELAFHVHKGTADADPNLGDEDVVCCLCGEMADQKCVECGDLYCSRTWMGNPGCWATTHAKGAKQKHKTITLASLKPAAPPPGGYGQFAPKSKRSS